MKKLNDLIQLRKVTEEKGENKEFKTPGQEQERKRTYEQAGKEDAREGLGEKTMLKISLESIYAKFQNEEKENIEKQRQLKLPYEKEIKEKETIIKTTEVLLDNTKEKIEKRKENIETLKHEIAEMPGKPEKYGIEGGKGSLVKFWLGLVLLLLMTIYLITFYISTSYSAFFKTFDIDANTWGATFDAHAFSKSWQEGLLEGLFVSLIPFVFMGMGYLIHMFSESKKAINYLKVVLLFIIAFIFDCILAYQIENKIYQINQTLDSSPFTIEIAFTKVGFWAIIFAGFLVYVIWGLVLDFVLKEHKERDKIKIAIEERRKSIKIHEKTISELESTEHNHKKEIEGYKGRIEELKGIIAGTFIPAKEYGLYASEYFKGWLKFINGELKVQESEKKTLREECNKTFEQHLNETKANTENQNIVYRGRSL